MGHVIYDTIFVFHCSASFTMEGISWLEDTSSSKKSHSKNGIFPFWKLKQLQHKDKSLVSIQWSLPYSNTPFLPYLPEEATQYMEGVV